MSELSRLPALSRRVRQRLVSEVCRRLHRDPGLDAPTAMLVGTGRSGTTWLGEVIDAQIPCRLVFEPFNPDQVPEFSAFEYFQYMRPNEENPDLLSFCSGVVAGSIRGRWIDGHLAHLAPRLRLVKDIRSTLLLRWFRDRFPDVPLLLLLRHPCAVALSRMRLGWDTDADIGRFLKQHKLVGDHLTPHLETIARARAEEEKHAVIWCVSYLVPLQQFGAGELTCVRYETLRQRPDTEVPRICAALGIPFDRRALDAIDRPSRTTRGTTARQLTDVTAWRDALRPQQIDRVLAVVRAFGLDHLYGESTMPLTAPATGTVRHVPQHA